MQLLSLKFLHVHLHFALSLPPFSSNSLTIDWWFNMAAKSTGKKSSLLVLWMTLTSTSLIYEWYQIYTIATSRQTVPSSPAHTSACMFTPIEQRRMYVYLETPVIAYVVYFAKCTACC